MRINRFLASCGVASRRKSDILVLEGRVMVNREIITEPGYIVDPLKDEVRVDGEIVKQKAKAYYKFYKPYGYITTLQDDKGRDTVMDFFTDLNIGLFPVGRLDKDSEGLLIFTNDGKLSHRLAHPKHKVEKFYEVVVNKRLRAEDVRKLENGVRLEEGITAKCKVEITGATKKSTELLIVLKQGWYRQIRRMLATVGAEVKSLKRTFFGPIGLGNLMPGEKRKLTNSELRELKKNLKMD